MLRPGADAAMETGDRTLGIIGGAGVGAAAALYIDVSARFRAATGALPQIAIWNLPLSDELERSFLGAGADPAAVSAAQALVAEGVDRLAAVVATVVAMPCNSLQRAAARGLIDPRRPLPRPWSSRWPASRKCCTQALGAPALAADRG